MKMKSLLKKGYHKLRTYIEFIHEGHYFCKYYTNASFNQSNLEYRLLILVHSIEKGLCTQAQVRPFGNKKVSEIIEVIKLYEKKGYTKGFAFYLSLSMLDEYRKFYEKYNFTNEKIYKDVVDILSIFNDFEKINCGPEEYIFQNLNFDYMKLISSRHSIRKFSSIPVSIDEVYYAINCAIQSPSACNRQMIKVYCFLNQDTLKINLIHKYAQGLSGFDQDNMNYFIITYDESALFFPGERNQGMFNAGLFCMNLVNALHNEGIGSCFIQFANLLKEERKMKQEIGIPSNERIAVFIAFGKYEGRYLVPKSARKDVKDILKVMKDE